MLEIKLLRCLLSGKHPEGVITQRFEMKGTSMGAAQRSEITETVNQRLFKKMPILS